MANVSGLKKLFNVFRQTQGSAGGMHTDNPISLQPDGTWRNAWGVSTQSSEEKGSGLYNMAGMADCVKLPAGADKRGEHFLEERNHMVVFLDIGGKSEIGYWSTDTCEYKKIIDDNDIVGCKLDFGTEEWIPIVSKIIPNGTCSEMHIYWSNGGNYKTLNIDRPCVPIDCDEIKLFNCKCVPSPRAFTTKKGGYDLAAGARQFFAQLQDEDGNVTNFFSISNPIYIGSENNRAGDRSDQAITIFIDHLDPDYPYINLGVIETIGGHPSAKVIGRLGYSPNGVSFFYRSKSQILYDLAIEEILVKKPGYIQGPDLFQHNKVLYLLNTKAIREPDMQARIIAQVKSKYKVGRVQMRHAHHFSGNQRNGVYSYSVNYNYCDGRKTRGYHFACFGTMPVTGPGCYDCEDKNYGSNGTPTTINGKPYDNPILKGDDIYTPFTETKDPILNNSDFDVPDDKQFLPPDTSGEGNACACWAWDTALKTIFNPLHPKAIPGKNYINTELEARYNVLKDLCESGCTDADLQTLQEEGILPRSDSIDISTMPTDDGTETTPDKRFKSIDDIDLTNGEKPTSDDITGSVGQGGDGNNTDTTNTVHSGSSSTGPTSGNVPVTITDCEPTIVYADSDCCVIKEIIPCIDSEGDPTVYISCERYPDEERCCAEGKTYGTLAGEFIRYFRMPTLEEQPHFISYHDGVPSAEHRDNHEYNNSFARFIWMEFSDIPLPEPDEIDVPLCPNTPYTINWELRDEANNTVLASGVLLPTFEGETLGEPMLFPAHGTSSPERVDRWINNHGSHKSSIDTPISAYVFHSPDMAFDRPPPVADYMHNALGITGRGWLHELYDEGLDPDSSYIGKKNRKGARASMNLNKWDNDVKQDIRCVKAISYVDANSVLDKSDEFSRSLSNIDRESCVYIETDGTKIPMVDTSFDRDIEKRQKPLEGQARYVSLNRYIPNAYGGVTDNVYYPIWQGKSEDIVDGKAKCLVMAGDTFINYWSIKRTSNVSNHVAPQTERGIKPNFEYGGGITLPWPFKGMLRKLFSTISADCGCGTVPQAGNKLRDPRADNALNGSGKPDRYFPQVQTQLVSFPVESRVNLGFQGSGDDFSESTYRDLNGQIFDSTFSGGKGDFTHSWMSRYFATMCENPKWKCLIRTIVTFLFTYGVGVFLILKGLKMIADGLEHTEVGFVITIFSIVAVGMGIGLMIIGFIWIIAWVNTDLDNRMIDNILGIVDCFPDKRPKSNGDGDAEMKDTRVQGLEDNHYEYNYDFSLVNKIEAILGLPAGFDPCSCPNETSFPIWHSNPQNPESHRDAYRNFKTNGYFPIPSHHGHPQKMFDLQGSVYVQTTDAMFRVMEGNINGDNPYLQTAGQFLMYPQLILGSLQEGEGGTKDPNACEVTKWGYLSCDVESRRFYLFTGSNYEPLPPGMDGFFDTNMPYLNEGAVRDEKSKNGSGFSIGVDNARDILFITKIDKNGEKDRSWTLSLNMKNRTWIGFEYFKPLVYSWDRYNMYSQNESDIWVHNKIGEYSTVYGKSVPMIVDFVIRDEQTQDSFAWHNTVVDADFGVWDDMGLVPKNDIFFTEIGFYNSDQSSGLMPVVHRDDQSTIEGIEEDSKILPVAGLYKRWRFNKLKDKSLSTGQRLFSTWRDSIFTDFVDGTIGEVQTRDKIIDNYIVMRLVFAGGKNVRVLLKNVITTVNPEEL